MNTLEDQEIIQLKQILKSHSLYGALTNWDSVRIFMEYHVFAVWDFMSLLKSLQSSLCSSHVPWFPPALPKAARLINQIVLDEETDIAPDGSIKSHFQLYLAAMEEMKCRTTPILEFVSSIREKPYLLPKESKVKEEVLSRKIPHAAYEFVKTNFSLLEEPLAVRAAIFFHAREDIIPQMFIGILDQLPMTHQDFSCDLFKDYLKRHITTDHEVHAPLAKELLSDLIGSDDEQLRKAQRGVKKALQARIALWDDVKRELSLGKKF
jgi:hypothetical protein